MQRRNLLRLFIVSLGTWFGLKPRRARALVSGSGFTGNWKSDTGVIVSIVEQENLLTLDGSVEIGSYFQAIQCSLDKLGPSRASGTFSGTYWVVELEGDQIRAQSAERVITLVRVA